ncbi:MAG: hypothetical protein GC181_15720 [Bacteroidetes bacterium]|nr:hypothetical protein [Bacteroidota bacterium]
MSMENFNIKRFVNPATGIYTLFFFALLFLGINSSFAQNSKKAAAEYQKSKDALEKQDYSKMAGLMVSAMQTELTYEKPDYTFIGQILEELGSWLISDNTYLAQSSEYYFLASINYARGGDYEKAKSANDKAADLQDSIRKYDVQLPFPEGDVLYDNLYFPVGKILKIKGDTTWFELEAGKNEGVEAEQTGWILTRYDSDSERGNREYGKYFITEIHNTYSIAKAVRSGDGKNLTLLSGDNALVRVPVPVSTYKGLLFELTKLNVIFANDFKKRLFNYCQIRSITKETSEEAIVSVMRRIVYETADYLYNPNDSTDKLNIPLAGGKYQGSNMWEAMLNTRNQDVFDFLDFVKSYPAKYMGRKYRIDETYATWIINFTPLGESTIETLTNDFIYMSQHDSLQEWVDQNMGYINSEGLDYKKLSDTYYNLIGDSAYDVVNRSADQLIGIAKKLKNDSLVVEFLNLKGQNLDYQKKYESSIDTYKEALKAGFQNDNTNWFLGNAYLSNEDYKRALEQYTYLMERYPEWAGGYGMYGWAQLKQGNFPDALKNCEKAFHLDSFNTTYIMNLAHAYLLTDNQNKARDLYMMCLENMNYTSSFTEGIMKDFQFFIDKYWQPNVVRRERDFLQQQWDRHYKFKVEANESFEEGKKLQDKGEYAQAAKAFENSISNELKGESIRYDWLRSYYRWAAYQYYKNKDFDKAVDRYQAGWEVSRTKLSDLSNEISDLENIANVYDWLNNDVQEDMYRKMQYAAQRKMQIQTRSNNLYVISIGSNNYHGNGYRYAETDADLIANTIREKSTQVFDKTDIHVFNSKNSSALELRKAFEHVITDSKPGDCFVLYYSGYSPKNGNGQMIFGIDTLNNQHLIGWIKMMQADKKLILMDAANSSFIKQYAEQKETSEMLFNNENLTFILSDGRVELPNEKSGLFTSYLIKGLSGDAMVTWNSRIKIEGTDAGTSMAQISAKGLEGYMYGKLSRNNMQFELKSYSYGADFPVAYSPIYNEAGKDTIPPMIYISGAVGGEGTRGGKSKSVSAEGNINGQAVDASGIEQILINGKPVDFTQNGKFNLTSDFVKSWTKIVVKAKDKNGLWGTDSFYLNRELSNSAMSKGPNDNAQGTNYALLFATDEYDFWSDLKNPINDAEQIGAILQADYGFNVKIIRNATLNQMKDTLMSYFSKPYGPKDQLFVFFAGHGVHHTFLGGQIVCKDSRPIDEEKTMSSYLSFEWVKNGLNNIYSCQHVLLTMDVCYGGAGFNQKTAPYYGDQSVNAMIANPSQFFRDNLKFKTRLYLTSGDSTYVSDGRGSHSPFAERFIATLNTKGSSKGGILTLADFAGNMRFTEEGRQKVCYGSFGDSNPDGDFIFLYQGTSLKQNASAGAVSSGG